MRLSILGFAAIEGTSYTLRVERTDEDGQTRSLCGSVVVEQSPGPGEQPPQRQHYGEQEQEIRHFRGVNWS